MFPPPGDRVRRITGISKMPKFLEEFFKKHRPLKRIVPLKCIDIGANLTDGMFKGIYNGSSKHPPDLDIVLQRAWRHELQKIIVTVGCQEDYKDALEIVCRDERIYMTMGCHPTRCQEFAKEPDAYYNRLRQILSFEGCRKIVAIGECGLDFDRLQFCDSPTQCIYFERQLELAAEFQLPLFLHCRNAHVEFMKILERNRDKIERSGGAVVHSFDGSFQEAESILNFHPNFYIGINGCSLKTAENLETVRRLPAERLMLETDSPWCGIRPSHAGSQHVLTKFTTVKSNKWSEPVDGNEAVLVDGRCEPCQISQVLEVVAAIKKRSDSQLAPIFLANTNRLFFQQAGRERRRHHY